MKTKIFDFHIPESLIAQYPSKVRSDSRLLVYYKKNDLIIDSYTKNISDFLNEECFLIFNNSKVIPVRFYITRKESNRSGEIFILKILDEHTVEVITDKSKKYPTGTELLFPGKNTVIVEKSYDTGIKLLKSQDPIFTISYINKFGNVPLPPYIKKNPDKNDKKRYQTTFSKYHGSSAAPTAGLHFDKKIFKSFNKKNIDYAFVTLHVGLGTFQPIYSENIEAHEIHSEEYNISRDQAEKINKAIKDKKKIIPVGTTSLRTIETAYENNEIKYGKGDSNLYIYPSYKFKIVSGLVTNFHTPKSSLAVLVAAMIGVEKLLELYKYAVKKEYRFFSYGDAMLII
jgi:S-adenosylmethionine:tRNA ribosyltransferase-isomerase